MRALFANLMHAEMARREDIFILTGDLGYKMWDRVRDDYPDRFVNVGAAEQAMLDISVGLALSGKRAVVYSITPFLLYRGFETIRTYINHEKLNVVLVGGGRNYDYEHDGISHWATDDLKIMSALSNIACYHPETDEEVRTYLEKSLRSLSPSYINLRRT